MRGTKYNRRESNVFMPIFVVIVGLVVGYFLGELMVFLSELTTWLNFLSFFGRAFSTGLDHMSINLLFAQLSFGFTLNLSLMGIISALIFLLIYLKRR